MQLSTLAPRTKNRRKKRVGRGGKRGTYSGRGLKGQKSRAGRKIRPALRDVMQQIPKLRGRGKNILTSRKEQPVIVNIGAILETFSPDDKVTPETLCERGLVKMKEKKIPKIKILGDGKVTHAVTISGCIVSSPAREKIKKAGGKVEEVVTKK